MKKKKKIYLNINTKNNIVISLSKHYNNLYYQTNKKKNTNNLPNTFSKQNVLGI